MSNELSQELANFENIIRRQIQEASNERTREVYCPHCGELTGYINRQPLMNGSVYVNATFLQRGSTCPLCSKGASIAMSDLDNADRLGQFGAQVNYNPETGEPLNKE